METEDDETKIVLERLSTMPSSLKLSLGNVGSLNRDEMMDEIKKHSKTGELIVKVYMTHLRSFKESIQLVRNFS